MNSINIKKKKNSSVSYKFGIIAMFAGLIGVPLGSYIAQRIRPINGACDPLICAYGLIISSPLVYLSLILPRTNEFFCFFFMFFAEISLNLCWSLVADILLVSLQKLTEKNIHIMKNHKN